MSFNLTSDAFASGESIPRRYTGDGEDISPPLSWVNLPEGTAALALMCEDPDAPRVEPWVHWLLYDFSPSLNTLPEGVSTDAAPTELPGAHQGRNTWEKLGYGGPAPPRGHGLHHYIFTLYALRQGTGLAANASKAELLVAIEGHVIATATLIGTYERKA